MAIAFRAASTAADANVDNIVIERPPSVTENDVMVAFVFAPHLDAPTCSGWTLVRTDVVPSSTLTLWSYYKAAGGSEPSDYTFLFSSEVGGSILAAISAYSGVNTADPVDVDGGDASSIVGTSAIAPSVTPTVSGNWLVAAFATDSAATFSTPSGMTERTDFTGSSVAMALDDENYGATSATGTRSSTISGAGVWAAQLLALSPGGSTTHTLTLTENLGHANAFSRTSVSNRSLSSTAGSSQTFARLSDALRNLSDTLGFDDEFARTVTAGTTFTRAFTENLGFSEIFSRRADASRSLSNSAGLTQAFSQSSLQGASASLPLFLKGQEGTVSSGVLPLFAFGSTGSGVHGGLDLFAMCATGSNVATGVLPLYLEGSSRGDFSGILPLYAFAEYPSLTAGLDLFLYQGTSGAQGVLNLYARGSGVTPGYSPHHDVLPLWIQRGEADALMLFLRGEGTLSSGVLPLYAAGGIAASCAVLLYASGVGTSSNSLSLFTHGF